MNTPVSKGSIAPAQSGSGQKEMHLFEHLAELRRRIIASAIILTIGSIVAYFFSSEIFTFLTAPYHRTFDNSTLIGTGPAEAFLLKIQIAIIAGLIGTSPLLFHQVWRFIEPGLLENEKRYLIPFVLGTSGLFLGGIWFCYSVVFPFAFVFFYEQYQSIGVTPAVKIGEHLAFVTRGLLAFGLIFEMPVLAFILGRMGLIDHTTLIRFARYAIVAIFVIAAILTPPDAITQILLAVPLLLLYCLSILILKYTARRTPDGGA